MAIADLLLSACPISDAAISLYQGWSVPLGTLTASMEEEALGALLDELEARGLSLCIGASRESSLSPQTPIILGLELCQTRSISSFTPPEDDAALAAFVNRPLPWPTDELPQLSLIAQGPLADGVLMYGAQVETQMDEESWEWRILGDAAQIPRRAPLVFEYATSGPYQNEYECCMGVLGAPLARVSDRGVAVAQPSVDALRYATRYASRFRRRRCRPEHLLVYRYR